MDDLFQYINISLSNGLTLKDIKSNLFTYFNSQVIEYCEKNILYTSGKYNRIKLYDYSNDLFEIILICWDTNSESKIHDHPENGCALRLMKGCLEEHLYDSELRLKQIYKFNANNTSYMENSMGYHKIKCIKKAMSLHIYSPPSHKMKILG